VNHVDIVQAVGQLRLRLFQNSAEGFEQERVIQLPCHVTLVKLQEEAQVSICRYKAAVLCEIIRDAAHDFRVTIIQPMVTLQAMVEKANPLIVVLDQEEAVVVAVINDTIVAHHLKATLKIGHLQRWLLFLSQASYRTQLAKEQQQHNQSVLIHVHLNRYSVGNKGTQNSSYNENI